MILLNIANKTREVKFKFFKINESCLYLIKELSGDSENAIITYFYELGLRLFIDSASKKRTPYRVNRNTKMYYKNTQILVKFDVWSTNLITDNDFYDKNVYLMMDVGFTSSKTIIDGHKIESILTESSLGLSEDQVLDVEKPKEKKYRVHK